MPVHRFVVSASSEYFDAMLSHDTKENNEGVVEMKEVDPDCVVKCVDFMYTGEAAVAEENRRDLMHVAHMLQLKRLYNGIAVFLEKKLDCSSFFSTREIAKLYDCHKLENYCNEFAFKNFRALATLEDFRTLEGSYVDFLLSSDDLKETDAIKCKAITMWINHDSKRAVSLLDLMKHIDFSKISVSYRRFLIENEPALSESLECQNYVMRSMFVNANKEAADISIEAMPGIMLLDTASGKLKCLDIKEIKWTDMQEMCKDILNVNCSVVMLDDYIYVFTSNMMTFRLKYKETYANWEQLAKRNGSCWGDALVLNGIIYGTEYCKHSNRIERYDPNRNEWSFIPNRSVSLLGSAAVVAGNMSGPCQSENLFLLGGRQNDNRDSNVVEQFDPTSSSWSKAPALRRGRWNASATTLNEALYIFGGKYYNYVHHHYHTYGSRVNDDTEFLQTVEILFPNANVWQSISLNNFTRQNFTSLSIDGKIYLVGNRSSNFQTIDEYDTNTRNLKTIATLNNMNVSYFSSIAVVI